MGMFHLSSDLHTPLPEPVPLSRIRYYLSFLGQRWGMGSPRFSQNQVVEWSRRIAKAGGVITWDVPIQKSGLILEPFIEQLTAVGKAISGR